MPRRSMLVLAVAVVLAQPGAFPAASSVFAGAPTDQLRGQIDKVLKLLEDPELKKETKVAERRVAVRRVAEQIFDFGETAKRSLGRHWASRTPTERDEFIPLFADLLEHSYLSKIELYGGEKIAFAGDSVDGDQATVRTKILTKSGSEVPVDYRMLRKGDRWAVYDVIIEGVSLVSNYRTQFNKIIQTSSYEELVKKLRAKQGEFREDEKPKRT
jgi:phospholipid transport system substrate-binding protein